MDIKLKQDIVDNKPYVRKSILNSSSEEEVEVDPLDNPYNTEKDSFCTKIHLQIHTDFIKKDELKKLERFNSRKRVGFIEKEYEFEDLPVEVKEAKMYLGLESGFIAIYNLKTVLEPLHYINGNS